MDRNEIEVGDRIELSPSTDRWTGGDKTGVVIEKFDYRVRALMDTSGIKAMVYYSNIQRKI